MFEDPENQRADTESKQPAPPTPSLTCRMFPWCRYLWWCNSPTTRIRTVAANRCAWRLPGCGQRLPWPSPHTDWWWCRWQTTMRVLECWLRHFSCPSTRACSCILTVKPGCKSSHPRWTNCIVVHIYWWFFLFCRLLPVVRDGISQTISATSQC